MATISKSAQAAKAVASKISKTKAAAAVQTKDIKMLGQTYPEHRQLWACLSAHIYGVGPTISKRILSNLGINPSCKVRDLPPEVVPQLRRELEKNWIIEDKAKARVGASIQKLVDIGCYKGIRHMMKLPVNGQKTKTNAASAKKVAGWRLNFFGIRSKGAQ